MKFSCLAGVIGMTQYISEFQMYLIKMLSILGCDPSIMNSEKIYAQFQDFEIELKIDISYSEDYLKTVISWVVSVGTDYF